MKKLFTCFLTLLIFLTVPVIAAASGYYVHDEAGIMTTDQADELDQLARELSGKYGMDIVILTVDTLDGRSSMSYADDYYDINGYGEDGMLLMIAMEEREWYISTCGDAIYTFSDYEIDFLLDLALPYFSSGLYYEGFSTVLCDIPSHIDSQESTERYERPVTTRSSDREFWSILLMSMLIGAVAAGITLLIMRGAMDTKRKQRSAVNYMRQGSYRLRIHQDMFLYSQVSKTPRQTSSSSGGSSVHRSSGGRMHGGGGRKF